jgi:hypothetical protein
MNADGKDLLMTTRQPAAPRAGSMRKIALAAGILYLLTFVSIPTLSLYAPVHDPNYIIGPGPDTPVIVGGILEIIVALAGIGTAVALFPLVKRQNEGVALVALHDWFRLGQNLMPALNDLLLGYLLYQSRLVPRVLPVLGFIGAPLLIANTIVLMFGITSGPIYLLTGIGVLPIALFEFLLGVWLTVKGFNASGISSLSEKAATSGLLNAA